MTQDSENATSRLPCDDCRSAPRWDIFVVCRSCLEKWAREQPEGSAHVKPALRALTEERSE